MIQENYVSVILPVYNGEKYIHEAIQSILNQSFSNFELIVINDGSTDQSKIIIETFSDERINFIENESNIGLIRTLNKGISLAKGEFIARMDADDISYPTRLEKQVAFLKDNPSCILCGSWAKIIDAKGSQTGRIKRIDSNDMLRANLFFTTPFIHPTVMMRSTVIKNNPYSENALHCEDLELWCRLAQDQNYRFANLPEYLLDYRWHDSNISVENADFQSEKRVQILTEMIKFLIEQPNSEEINTHFSLFQNDTKISDQHVQLEIKKWFSKLLAANSTKSFLNQQALEALLLSRWIILCIKSKSIFQLFNSGLTWWDPSIALKTVRLLRFK